MLVEWIIWAHRTFKSAVSNIDSRKYKRPSINPWDCGRSHHAVTGPSCPGTTCSVCPKEISEIHDEKDLISELEQLLDEFLPPATTLLSPELLTAWWNYINDAILPHSELGEEEISRIIDIGVFLHG